MAGSYVLTDPQGLVGTPPIAGFSAIKPYLEHNRELARWRSAQRVCPSAAILGNSRAEIGFDPDHSAFAAAGLTAFNLAIPGSGLRTARDQLHWLDAAGCGPRLLVVGVDFPDFLVDPTRALPRAPLPETSPPTVGLRTLAETVFSLKGLRDSVETVLAQRWPFAPTTTPKGLNPLRSYIPDIERSGQYVLFRQRAEDNFRAWRKSPHSLDAAGGVPAADFDDLRAIVASARASQAKVFIVIYPYHAQLRIMLDALGFSALFDEWKRRVLAIAEDARRTNPNVEVWDFSLVSAETTEAIPVPGDRRHVSLGYWEAGHFRRELGDRMLDQMLSGASGFGVRLDSRNLDDVLRRDREALAALVRDSPLTDEVRQISVAAGGVSAAGKRPSR